MTRGCFAHCVGDEAAAEEDQSKGPKCGDDAGDDTRDGGYLRKGGFVLGRWGVEATSGLVD